VTVPNQATFTCETVKALDTIRHIPSISCPDFAPAAQVCCKEAPVPVPVPVPVPAPAPAPVENPKGMMMMMMMMGMMK
jgi:hypothetical protein